MVGTTLSCFVIVVSVADGGCISFLGKGGGGFMALGRTVPSGGGNITETFKSVELHFIVPNTV